MIIGVPKEIKVEEFRVGLTPLGARELTGSGHSVLVESDAGAGSGFDNDEYRRAGALSESRETVFGKAELIVKVKEPVREEYGLFREGTALFTYLHLAPTRNSQRCCSRKRSRALHMRPLRSAEDFRCLRR